ncbi:NADP-dependent oxidoreductase [Pseudonocardia sp. GCM10023141]|uniref:NADP-dependent oxidoreductase n=1 Tax=Pseudonocardia sp. GCM10023141 TaxID=3252653 RepID=UPI00361CCC13
MPPQSSRAIRFHRYGGPDELGLVDVPMPEPAAGEVRLRVVAAGVNPVECRIRRGDLASGTPLPAPRGLGTDVAGVVDAVGAGVEELVPGDEVFGRALCDGYAEHAIAVPSDLIARPAELPWDVAASIAIPGETAFRTLGLLGVVAPAGGTTVLVHGASGGVGTVAVQLAVLRGARVLGTAGEAHHERLRQAGVEPVAYGDGWLERVRALAPDGVDAVLDAAGRGVLPGSIALAGGPDRVVTIADRRDAGALGVTYSRGLVSRVPMAEVFAELLPALRSGGIVVPVAVHLPLADAARAHRISEGGHPGGRIVLTVPSAQPGGIRYTASTPASSR